MSQVEQAGPLQWFCHDPTWPVQLRSKLVADSPKPGHDLSTLVMLVQQREEATVRSAVEIGFYIVLLWLFILSGGAFQQATPTGNQK